MIYLLIYCLGFIFTVWILTKNRNEYYEYDLITESYRDTGTDVIFNGMAWPIAWMVWLYYNVKVLSNKFKQYGNNCRLC